MKILAVWNIIAFKNLELMIFADFKISAFQNPEIKILALKNTEIKILADFMILAFQNPEFKTLAFFKIVAF